MYTPTHQPKRTLSRRRFLQLSAVAGTGLLGTLAAMLPRVSAVPQALAGTIPGPTYSEAPMLADLVTRGQLPPVDQRLPTVPGVIPTIESAGKYGDRIRRLHRGRADRFGLTKIIDHGLAWFDHDLTMRPHIAEAWEVNADATVWTFMLRAGMKWSDGEPFTTADIHWWYDNELTNVEITPNPPERFTTGDTLMQIEVIDAQTVKFRFADPYPLFVQRIARLDNAIYAPSHYLAHFHMATTADQTALQQEYEQAGFTNWVDYYNDRNTWYLNPAKPSLAPWLALNTLGEGRFVMERNPYFFGVDSTGQQLPYVDRVEHEHVVYDRQIEQFVTSGAVDFQARHIAAGKLAFYQQHAAAGDYRVVTGVSAGHLALQLNLTTDDSQLHNFFREQKVRIALSLAADRVAINEQIYGGIATPRQYSPLSQSPQFHAALANAYLAYDPTQANTLLDQANYSTKDAQGFRLRPDGERIHFTIEGTAEVTSPEILALQQVIQNFAAVGISAAYQQVDRATYEEHVNTNQITAAWWGGDRTILPLLAPEIFLGTVFDRPWAVAWGAWRRDPNDTIADPPPPDHWIRDIWALWDQIATTVDTAEQTRLFKELLDIWARELPMIGVLGEFPAPVIMKNGLRNYVAGYPIDDTTGDEHLLNPETLFWDAAAPMVSLNYTTGQPGSYFTLSATNFPPNRNATLSVNGLPIATTTTDELGGATVILDTSLLPDGDYRALLSVNPQASIPFILSTDQPLRAKEGNGEVTTIPIDVTLQHTYLPMVSR